MTRGELARVIATMSPDQLNALRVCLMAERRLRVIYPRSAVSIPELTEAYEWALEASAAQRGKIEVPI